MIARLVAVALDAREPTELGRFWANALGWDLRADEVGIGLAPTDPTTFQLTLRSVVDAKIGQNRIHFDLTTTSSDDQADTVAQLLAIGARHADIGPALQSR